jgi:hypothetical protein
MSEEQTCSRCKHWGESQIESVRYREKICNNGVVNLFVLGTHFAPEPDFGCVEWKSIKGESE